MNKGDLTVILSRKENLVTWKAKKVIDTLFEIMSEGIEKDNRVFIKDFGTFQIRRMKSRKIRNPHTNGEMFTKEYNKTVFIAHKKLKEKVNK